MFFGCWNIRGPKEHMKQREVRKFIHEHHLSILGLVETKVKVVNKDMVLKAIDRNWKALCNYDHSPNGRIWVCWNPGKVFSHSILVRALSSFLRIGLSSLLFDQV
jgi:hypothetical protein